MRDIEGDGRDSVWFDIELFEATCPEEYNRLMTIQINILKETADLGLSYNALGRAIGVNAFDVELQMRAKARKILGAR